MVDGNVKIKEVFTKDNYFIVPDYQRSYSWEEAQQKDFFEDFKDSYNNVNYYYGTLLIYQSDEKKDIYDIVDGQQRITTLTIFMYCLLNRIRDKINYTKFGYDKSDIDDLEKCFIINKGIYKLELQPQDSSFFQDNVLDEKGKNTINTPAQNKLLNAKKYFQKWINELDDDSVFRILENIKEAKVLVYTIKNKKEASMIFETTNDRGKPLTNLEKLKSYLMYKISSTLKDSEQKLKYIEQSFSNIYTNVEKLKTIVGTEFNEDDVLRYNFIAKEKWNTSENKKPYQNYMEELKKQIDKLIKKGIEDNKKEKKSDEIIEEEYKDFRVYIENYVVNLKNTFDHMVKILSDENNLDINDLKATEHIANFYPLLIKCYKLDESEEKKFFYEICRLCEIFSFRVYVIGEKMASKAQTSFYNLARDFEGDFEWLKIKIATLIRENSSEKEFIENLCREDFYLKYNTSERNYFFWKYENYLRTEKQPYCTTMSHKDLWEKQNKKSKLTIEHIISQSNDNEKNDAIDGSTKISLDNGKFIEDPEIIYIKNVEEFNEKYLNCIGNLAIDPQSANSSKGYKDVEEKNKKYFKESVYKSQKELEHYLKDINFENENIKKRFTIDSIVERRNDLVTFAMKMWCEPLNEYPKENKEKTEKVRSSITVKQYMYSYELAKKVYENEITLDEAIEKLVNEAGVKSKSSADLYVRGMCNILKGVSIGPSIKNDAIRYVLDKIYVEYPKETIEKAINSIKLYSEQDNNKHNKEIRNIYEEYKLKYEKIK